jgi:hypothetical protein
LPAHRTPRVDLFEAFVQLANSGADNAPIALELRLTRSAQADATFLSLKVRPAANEPRGQVPELRKFHLQFALKTSGPLRKNIENQACAIEYPAL